MSETLGRGRPGRRSPSRRDSASVEASGPVVTPGGGNVTCDTSVLNPLGTLFALLGIYIAFFSSSLLASLLFVSVLALIAVPLVRYYRLAEGARLPTVGLPVETGAIGKRGRRRRRSATGGRLGGRGRQRGGLPSAVRRVREMVTRRRVRGGRAGGDRL